MRFEWDEDKNLSNLRKHKISFEVARLVFDNPYARSALDRIAHGEERWQTLGMIRGVFVVVARTYREERGACDPDHFCPKSYTGGKESLC